MINQTQQVEKVSDVIQVLQAGIEFYQEAIVEVQNESVKSTFRKMINNKEDSVQRLQPLAIAEQGEKEQGSSWAVDARKMYTKFIGKMSDHQDHTYVNQLEEVEDKVLEVLDDAIEKEQPDAALTTLRTIRAKAQEMHDEMKALQMATKH